MNNVPRQRPGSCRIFSRAGLAALLILTIFTPMASTDERGCHRPITPTDGAIKLFNGKDLGGLSTWLQDTGHEDPRKVFTVHDRMLHISGNGGGYVRTVGIYKNYHMIIEFKWGDRTWEPRKNRAKDSGVLVHCTEPDGSYQGLFMAGIEAQIIEGGIGDFIVCPGKDVDGTAIPVSIVAEVVHDRDGEIVWRQGGKKQRFTSGRVNWYGRDPDWDDVLGFRGKDDVESPGNQWCRMDVICDGPGITIMVNGVLVNQAVNATPSDGMLLVQSELAEIFIRRWELWPLHKAPPYVPLSCEAVQLRHRIFSSARPHWWKVDQWKVLLMPRGIFQ